MSVWIAIQRTAASVVAVLLLAIVIGLFYPRLQERREMQLRQQRMQQELDFEKEMLEHLKTKQQRLLNDPRFVERIAREELGLAKPGETIFKFAEDTSTNRSATP